MADRQVYILASSLITIGLILFLYKVWGLGFPVTPKKTADVWILETRMSFLGRDKPAKVSLFIPRDDQNFIITDHQPITQGYGYSINRKNGNIQVVFAIRKASGEQVLYYRIIATQLNRGLPAVRSEIPRQSFRPLEGAPLIAARAIVDEAKKKSADRSTFAVALLKKLLESPRKKDVKVFLGNNSSLKKLAEVSTTLLGFAGVPARPVHGLHLTGNKKSAKFTHWLEIYINGAWHPFSLETGEASIPDSYFPWWRGTLPMVRLRGGEALKVDISVARQQETALDTALAVGSKERMLLIFSLFSLPVDTQNVFRVLLPLSLGVLTLVILRNIIGIKTIGVFIPALVALSFRQVQLFWGIPLFCLVVACGLGVRIYLERLRLLLVPRMASVMLFVILFIAVISVISHGLGLRRGLSVSLFPIVILTVTIDRISVVWEEAGPYEALTQALGTLIAAVLIYPLISAEASEHLMFVFPELILVLMGATVLLGRYTGYRLTELYRFRHFTS